MKIKNYLKNDKIKIIFNEQHIEIKCIKIKYKI